MKKCNKCGETKELSQFGKDKSRNDGLTVSCKICTAIYNKEIRKKHNEKRTEYNREYRLKNKEKYNEWERNYYRNNSDTLRGNAKKWRESESGTFRTLHIVAKARAKKKNIPYELDDKVLMVLSEMQGHACALTGIKFDFSSNNQHRFRPFAPSIDRKENNKGYLWGNIQIVCVIVNKAKNEYSQELFDEMCKARVRKINGS